MLWLVFCTSVMPVMSWLCHVHYLPLFRRKVFRAKDIFTLSYSVLWRLLPKIRHQILEDYGILIQNTFIINMLNNIIAIVGDWCYFGDLCMLYSFILFNQISSCRIILLVLNNIIAIVDNHSFILDILHVKLFWKNKTCFFLIIFNDIFYKSVSVTISPAAKMVVGNDNIWWC